MAGDVANTRSASMQAFANMAYAGYWRKNSKFAGIPFTLPCCMIVVKWRQKDNGRGCGNIHGRQQIAPRAVGRMSRRSRSPDHPITQGGLLLFVEGQQRDDQQTESDHDGNRLICCHGLTSLLPGSGPTALERRSSVAPILYHMRDLQANTFSRSPILLCFVQSSKYLLIRLSKSSCVSSIAFLMSAFCSSILLTISAKRFWSSNGGTGINRFPYC